ncbi:MAG: transposase [Deltaproteobacteria bacterium]|nr:transposase [Deltaproteobacteria bacterium]
MSLNLFTTQAGGQFVSFLTYKAEEAGCYVERVNPRNTSKACSICGYVYSGMTLSVRSWTCPVCHTAHNRDENAAVNILNKTVRQELPAGIYAWGDKLYG